LLQNGTEMAQLVVSFSQTQIGANFAIPPLTGNLIKRLSLIPIKQTLQLLVDLDQRAQVQSFQVVDDPVQGYRLLIEIVATAEVAEKAPGQMSPFRSNPAGAEKSAEVVEPSAAKVSKNNNLPSRDREAYQAGLEQLKRGDVAAAEVNFNQALSVNPGLQEARLELINLLQQQRKLDRAEYFLQQGLSLAPENFELRKTYARLLLNDQRREEAVDLLQAEPLPGLTQDLEYHALLAALLQETGQFKAASSIYTQLVQVQPSALWWLGLAISLDQSGHPERARNAYQQAMSLPGLRPDLQSYIQSRLQVL
jgi:MSHA biogenesis protein MshN